MEYENEMRETIAKICAPYKGILAADESTGTIQKRFDSIGIENTHENRIKYRNLLFKTEGIENNISGVITYSETLEDVLESGTRLVQPLFDKGIVVGIKTDCGLANLPFSEEVMTLGLDTLAERSKRFYELGARFAKWRCVYEINIQKGYPSQLAIENNARTLALYAGISQQNGLVPIVEPEVLMDGNHSSLTSYEVTKKVLLEVYNQLYKHNVRVDLTLLKPNMVRYGTKFQEKDKISNYVAAEMTLQVLRETVPCDVQGIVFLSGGMTEEESTECLNLINSSKSKKPWRLSFSYGRALQKSTMKVWSQDINSDEVIKEAQNCFMQKARENGEASEGIYKN